MRSLLYRVLLMIFNRGARDLHQILLLEAKTGRQVLAMVDRERLATEIAIASQLGELNELRILGSCLLVKSQALRSGGFSEVHGPRLEELASRLQDDHGWDDDDVTDWFEPLVLDDEGENMGFEIFAGDFWDIDDDE